LTCTRKALASAFLISQIALISSSVAAQLPPRAQVLSWRAFPDSLGPAGGQIAIEADVRQALLCQLQVRPQRSFHIFYSRDASPACQDGYFVANIRVGPNPYRRRQSITFVLVASNSSSTATATIRVPVAGLS
jgi:hypothetical protein